jgi:hypothetical protein
MSDIKWSQCIGASDAALVAQPWWTESANFLPSLESGDISGFKAAFTDDTPGPDSIWWNKRATKRGIARLDRATIE